MRDYAAHEPEAQARGRSIPRLRVGFVCCRIVRGHLAIPSRRRRVDRADLPVGERHANYDGRRLARSLVLDKSPAQSTPPQKRALIRSQIVGNPLGSIRAHKALGLFARLQADVIALFTTLDPFPQRIVLFARAARIPVSGPTVETLASRLQ